MCGFGPVLTELVWILVMMVVMMMKATFPENKDGFEAIMDGVLNY